MIGQGRGPEVHCGAVRGQTRRRVSRKPPALPRGFTPKQGALSQQGRQHGSGKHVVCRIVAAGRKRVQLILRFARQLPQQMQMQKIIQGCCL